MSSEIDTCFLRYFDIHVVTGSGVPQNDERHQLHISARNLSSDHIYRDVQHFVTYRSSKWQDQFASHGFHNWEIIDRFKTNWIIEKITINEKTFQWKNCRSSVSEMWYHEISKISFKDELEVWEFKQKQCYGLHIRIFFIYFQKSCTNWLSDEETNGTSLTSRWRTDDTNLSCTPNM